MNISSINDRKFLEYASAISSKCRTIFTELSSGTAQVQIPQCVCVLSSGLDRAGGQRCVAMVTQLGYKIRNT